MIYGGLLSELQFNRNKRHLRRERLRNLEPGKVELSVIALMDLATSFSDNFRKFIFLVSDQIVNN